MELSDEVVIHAHREQVWQGLNDSTVLSRCIPGCETISEQGPNERDVTVKVKIGPVRARFAGHIRMDNIEPGVSCTLYFEGSGGAAGMAKGHSNVRLTDEAGATRLSYTAQASVGGKLGQVGGRMIDAAAKQMAGQFFAAFEKEMSGSEPSSVTPALQASAELHAKHESIDATASQKHETPGSSPKVWKERLLWFVMGSLSTGFGVLVAHWISS